MFLTSCFISLYVDFNICKTLSIPFIGNLSLSFPWSNFFSASYLKLFLLSLTQWLFFSLFHNTLNHSCRHQSLFAFSFSDDREGDFGVRVKGLEEKCRRRVKARLCNVLHVNHSQPLDPDDLDITVGHLVSFINE